MHFNPKEYKLTDWIELIETQIDVKINYSPSQILKESVKISNNTLSFQDCLDILNSQFNIDYFVENENVYLLKNYSQNITKKNISGYVKDMDSGEVLIGAFVTMNKSNNPVLTDEQGYFNMILDGKSDTLEISYVGYNTLKLGLNKLTGSLNSTFNLVRSGLLSEVVIKDNNINAISLNQMTSLYSLYKVENIISVLGTGDLINELSFLPGMEKLNDLQGGISINGFAPSDNYYYLDGIRIYEPNHIFGLFSSFNSNPVNKVSIYSHNIPGWYSGALSGVIDSHLKEGNTLKRQGSASIGLSDLNIYYTGPLIKYKTTILFDIRKSILDNYINGVLNNLVEFDMRKLDFYDINLKLTHKISPSNKINFIFYKGRDNIKIDNFIEEKLVSNNVFKWYNQAFALKWNILFKDDLMSELKMSMSNYENNSSSVFEFSKGSNENGFLSILSKNKIRDITLSHKFKYYSSTGTFNFGYSISKYNISPFINTKISENVVSPDVEIPDDSIFYLSYAFLDFKTNIIKGFDVLGSTQLNILNYNGFTEFYINPGINLAVKTGKRSFLQIGYNKTFETLHSLGNFTVGIPSVLWIGPDENIPATQMHNFSLVYNAGLRNYNLKVELYYKIIQNQLRYKNITDVYNPFSSKGVIVPILYDSQFNNDYVNIGNGKAYGINALLEYKSNDFENKISASTNRVYYLFEGLNHNEYFQGKYSMLYSFSWIFKYRFRKVDFLTTYKFHSGGAFTLPENIFYSMSGNDILDYSRINNTKFRDFHSLSLGVSRSYKLKMGMILFDFGLSNAFNHFNPTYAYLYKYKDYYKINEISGFPILPYFKIKVYFY